jgi:hypothetical protein
MVKTLCLSFLCILFTGISLFAQNNASWEIVETVDEFGDKTGEKRLAYQTTGTFSDSTTRNSTLDVLLLIDNPDSVRVTVFEYGRYKISLDDAIFTYKIGDIKIETVFLRGRHIYEEDEKISLIYLLKQGGLIKFSVYKNGSSYRFDVNADAFLTLLSENFRNKEARRKYSYRVEDINGRNIGVSFELNYKWTAEKEKLLRDDTFLQPLVMAFFSDKDGYKYENQWEISLIEQIRQLYSDPSMDYGSWGLVISH